MAQYDFDGMKLKLSDFTSKQDDFCTAVSQADESVDLNVQVSDGAIYGAVGSLLKSEWQNNCEVILQFRGYFDALISKAAEIYNSKQVAVEETVAELAAVNKPADVGNPSVGNVGTTNTDSSSSAMHMYNKQESQDTSGNGGVV